MVESGDKKESRPHAARVLVLDDEKQIRALVSQMLEIMGHQVFEARNLSEAREILSSIAADSSDHWTMAWAMDAAGDVDGAKAMYRSIDARPGGPQALMLYATGLFGGKFFHDLSWTPNLAARLAEAGVIPERLTIPEP